MRQRTAAAQSRQQQKPPAHDELISAQGQGVLSLGIPLEKRDGEAVGQRRQQHRTVPQQGEAAAQPAAGQIDQQHAAEAAQAAQQLGGIEPLIVKQLGGDQNGEEHVDRHQDGALDAGGVRHADIEQGILHEGLDQTQLRGLPQGGTCGKPQPPQGSAVEKHRHHTGKEKTQPRKDQLLRRIGGGNRQQAVADLHRREGAAPQQAAKGRQQADDHGALQGGGRDFFHRVNTPLDVPLRQEKVPCGMAAGNLFK